MESRYYDFYVSALLYNLLKIGKEPGEDIKTHL